MNKGKKQKIKRHQLEPLSNYDILDLVMKLKIPYFKGVFMRDEILRKKSKPKTCECWILNHASSQTDGSHWSSVVKDNNLAFYFDSYGKLAPPLEVIKYFGDDIHLYYNAKKYQSYGTNICGHLCLRFLYDFWRQRCKNKKNYKKPNHF